MTREEKLWFVGFGLMVWFMARNKGKNDLVTGAIGTPGDRPLTPQEVYSIARQVGFPADVARRMVAIAQRESGLIPSARCTNCFPGVVEDSIGLWQINMSGSLGQRRLEQFGIGSADELLDPLVNAKAAYVTWGGSERNLEIAWRINDEGAYNYRSKYLENLDNLPALETMELAYSGGGGAVNA